MSALAFCTAILSGSCKNIRHWQCTYYVQYTNASKQTFKKLNTQLFNGTSVAKNKTIKLLDTTITQMLLKSRVFVFVQDHALSKCCKLHNIASNFRKWSCKARTKKISAWNLCRNTTQYVLIHYNLLSTNKKTKKVHIHTCPWSSAEFWLAFRFNSWHTCLYKQKKSKLLLEFMNQNITGILLHNAIQQIRPYLHNT